MDLTRKSYHFKDHSSPSSCSILVVSSVAFRTSIAPYAYYNFLKDRKAAYREQKAKTQRKIVEIYHHTNGVPGYRIMRDLLVPYGLKHCNATIYKYMLELGLRSIVRRKKPNYHKGKVNKIFPNLLNQNFDVEKQTRLGVLISPNYF